MPAMRTRKIIRSVPKTHKAYGSSRNRKQRKRILVNGGAGFIGCHLCERLLEQGNEVICLDDFRTGSIENLAHVLNHPRFLLVEQDIGEPFCLKVDQIYNLLCHQHHQIRTAKTGVLGALNMLHLAKRLKVPILQASTIEVYDDPAAKDCSRVELFGPRASYGEGNRCVESLFLDYHREHQVAIKVCRIFNAYGPRMPLDDGQVVSSYLIQALQDKPITIYGTEAQTYSFCYVEDIVGALIKLMWTPPSFTGPINLGNPIEHNVLDLVEMIRLVTGSSSEVSFQPKPNDDPKQHQPDISLARKVLRWKPKVQLREGLTLTAAHFHEVLRKRHWPKPLLSQARQKQIHRFTEDKDTSWLYRS